MSYDEAVEAAAEAIGDVLGFEYSSLYNRPMARAAIAAALPHLKGGYDREAIARAIYRRHTGDSDPDAEPWFMHEDLADAVIEVLPPLDAPTDPAPGLEVPADDANAVGEPPEHVVEAVARWLHGRFGAAWWAAWSCATESFRGELRTAARDVLAVARDAEKEANR